MFIWDYCTVVCLPQQKTTISKTVQRCCTDHIKACNIRLNPDSHWSNALYRDLDTLQLKDGRNKFVLNRDDTAGFGLDTTYTRKQYQSMSLQQASRLVAFPRRSRVFFHLGATNNKFPSVQGLYARDKICPTSCTKMSCVSTFLSSITIICVP